jgi:hypothetical protein
MYHLELKSSSAWVLRRYALALASSTHFATTLPEKQGSGQEVSTVPRNKYALDLGSIAIPVETRCKNFGFCVSCIISLRCPHISHAISLNLRIKTAKLVRDRHTESTSTLPTPPVPSLDSCLFLPNHPLHSCTTRSVPREPTLGSVFHSTQSTLLAS